MRSAIAVFCLCVLPSLAASQLATAVQNQPGTKWEYTFLSRVDIEKRGGGDFVSGLNKLGEEGWEVINMTGPRGTKGYGETLFKRVKDAPRGPALPGRGGFEGGQGGRGRAEFRQQGGVGGRGSSGAGQPGGGGGTGGSRPEGASNQFDPGMIFDRMAQGRATINISDLRMGQDAAQAWAQKQGITNGQLTREQFVSYLKSPEAPQLRQRVLGNLKVTEGTVTTQVIRLKHARAGSLQKILHELYGQTIRMASDERTNSLILLATEPQVLEVTKLLMQLDGPDEK